MFLLPSLKNEEERMGLVRPAWEQGNSHGGLRAGTPGIRHHCPVVTRAELCDHLGMAVVPRVTLIWLLAQVVPSPWVLEPTQGKGFRSTPYDLSLPADHPFRGEREREREKVAVVAPTLSPKSVIARA